MVNRGLKIVCVVLLVLLPGLSALAQNTKGDRPTPTPRESRFKTPQKKSKVKRPSRRAKDGDRPGKRVSPPVTRTRGGERPGRPIRPMFSRTKPQDEEKPWRGDITRRRIKPRASAGRAVNVYPQPPTTNYSSRELRRGPRFNTNPNVKRVRRMQEKGDDRPRVGRPIRPTYHSKRPQHRERAWRGDLTGRRIRATPADRAYTRTQANYPRMPGRRMGAGGGRLSTVPRIGGRAKNTYTRRSFWVNNQSLRTRPLGGGNRAAINMLPGPGRQQPRFRSGRIVPRSASGAYLSRRSTNMWARFPRPKRKGERAITTDLAGKRLRSKNFETTRPVLTNPTMSYKKRIASGDRPYRGPAGGYMSRTRAGQRAWKGDIAHYRIRGGQPPGREKAFLGFLKGGGYRSATRPGPRGPLRGKAPGIGARGIGRYQGNIRVGKLGPRDQGEGYTGNIRAGKRAFRDQGEEYTGNIRAGKRGFRDQGEEYTGNIKAGKRGFRDQGEEYTGNIRAGKRGFRDQGEEYTGNIKAGKRGFQDQGEEYSGNIRARRGFNDQGEEYTGNIKVGKRGFTYQGEEYRGNIRQRRGFGDQGEEYTGNLKARRPEKGGGSVSGKLWNNRETPIPGKAYGGDAYRITRYSGNLKARRPEKGGGSVSGKLWNNDESPIPTKAYTGDAYRITRYSGNLKAKRPEKGGGSVSGKLWNNRETPIAGKAYTNDAYRVTRYAGNIKSKRPEKGGPEGADYRGNVRIARNHYSRNPNADPDAVRGLKATPAQRKADVYSRGMVRNWNYVKNPSSDDDAQRTREPGRAFYRSSAYTGNVKLHRFDLFGKRDNLAKELHPDARFVKLNRNNVPEEKDVVTNFKLWWARLFRKSETQPDHLKEKGRTPRYDKGEAGLWYE